MSLTESEFAILRQTIATRGTVRMALLPVTFIAWAAVTAALLHLSTTPVSAAFPVVGLCILVGGFEAIHALHVGVERIGRYLQVYYEAQHTTPKWETTAMAVGPALPGGGIDPLFTVVFITLSLLNLALGFGTSRPALNQGAIAVLHALFWARVIRARGAAGRQRAVDLETFRAIKSSQEETKV